MRTIIVIYLFFQLTINYAQVNLIPNPGFENISSCPIGGEFNFAEDWFPAIGTPDLYNRCAGFGFFGVDADCYQAPFNGDGYVGIYNSNAYSTSEFLEVALTRPLVKSKLYYIKFYVSPISCGSNNGLQNCYTDAIDLTFSESLYKSERLIDSIFIPPFEPAISNPLGEIINDTLNWKEVSGCYFAKGTENYAIIGAFDIFSNRKSAGCIGATGSYIFVDDVCVFEFDPVPDTLLLCKGEKKQLGKTFLDGIYEWNTGSNDSIIQVEKEGVYIINVKMKDCILSDTVIVLALEDDFNTMKYDTTICDGDEIVIGTYLPGSYQWSNGLENKEIKVKESGLYSLTVDNECGTYYSDFNVGVEKCVCEIFVPNVFSPNYDGINDYLECSIGCNYDFKTLKFKVFNRWGALIYNMQTEDISSVKWDGTYRNKLLDSGTYVYLLEYEYVKNGQTIKIKKSGDVTIVM